MGDGSDTMVSAGRDALRARAALLGAALLFSTGGAAIKSVALDAWSVAGLRSGVAALLLGLAWPLAWRPGPSVVVAVPYAATLVLFVAATKRTTAAEAIFLQSTAPLYVLLLAPVWLGERVRRQDVLALALMGAGLAVLLTAQAPPQRTAPDPVGGKVLGLASGLAWALTLLGLRAAARRGAAEPLGPVVWGNALAFLACVPVAWPLPPLRAVDLGVLLYLGAVQIGLAYLLLLRGLRGVPAPQAALLLLAEPALNPVWAGWVHGEWPPPLAWVGGGLVLTGAAAQVIFAKQST